MLLQPQNVLIHFHIFEDSNVLWVRVLKCLCHSTHLGFNCSRLWLPWLISMYQRLLYALVLSSFLLHSLHFSLLSVFVHGFALRSFELSSTVWLVPVRWALTLTVGKTRVSIALFFILLKYFSLNMEHHAIGGYVDRICWYINIDNKFWGLLCNILCNTYDRSNSWDCETGSLLAVLVLHR